MFEYSYLLVFIGSIMIFAIGISSLIKGEYTTFFVSLTPAGIILGGLYLKWNIRNERQLKNKDEII